MTQKEKLDQILFGLTNAKLNTNRIEQPDSGYIFIDLCEFLKIPLENGEDKILKEILLSDGYIDYTEQVTKLLIHISSNGIDFINKGGYEKLEEDRIQEQNKKVLELKLLNSTLTINKWTKYGIAASILISLIAIAISIIALIQGK